MTGRPLRVEVRELRGSFVVGEETVLLRALENKRAQPDQRPPYPTERGLWGGPRVVNNVETLAAVPWIVANGAAAFASIGDPEAPGTTLVQLTGAVRKPGIARGAARHVAPRAPRRARRVRRGTAQGRAGRRPGRRLPAADSLDTLLNHDALRAAGAIRGRARSSSLDDTTCLVDMATLMTRYLTDESCGKTIPCRIGVRRLAELGGGMCAGHGRPTDADLVEDLAADIRDGALCGLEKRRCQPVADRDAILRR